MSGVAQVLALVIAVGAFALVLVLVRRRLLKERFAIAWLIVGVGMMLLVLVRPILDRLSDSLGIRSGTTVLFLLAIFVVLAIQLQLSIAASRFEERLQDLAEAIALQGARSGLEPGPAVEEDNQGQDEA